MANAIAGAAHSAYRRRPDRHLLLSDRYAIADAVLGTPEMQAVRRVLRDHYFDHIGTGDIRADWMRDEGIPESVVTWVTRP